MKMRSKLCITLFLALEDLFLVLPAARAGDVTLSLLQNTGLYGPYHMSVDGTPTMLFCDDYVDHIDTGSTWTAEVITGASGNLDQTQMSKRNGWDQLGDNGAKADQAYSEKVYIELHMDAANQVTPNEAIWQIINSLLQGNWTDYANLNALIATALTNSDNLYMDVTVYTPPPGGVISSGPYKGDTPQEFDTVPDGGMTLMLLGGTLVGLATLRRKFRV